MRVCATIAENWSEAGNRSTENGGKLRPRLLLSVLQWALKQRPHRMLPPLMQEQKYRINNSHLSSRIIANTVFVVAGIKNTDRTSQH